MLKLQDSFKLLGGIWKNVERKDYSQESILQKFNKFCKKRKLEKKYYKLILVFKNLLAWNARLW